MNYYEKIIQEKKNSTVARGTVHGHKYEVDRMSDGSYMGYVYDEEDFPIFKTGLHSTSSGAEQEIKSKVFNSKDNSKSYYQSIIEKKNADPEESMRKLQALKPIVEAFKRKGMTRHEVAMRLMQERDITETLAQQCVDTWY